MKKYLWLLMGLWLGLSTSAWASGGEDVQITGVITAITANSVTVQSTVFLVDESTNIEDESGEHISFSSLQIDDYVKVEGEYDGDNLVAREIKKKTTGDNGDDNGGGNGGDGALIKAEGIISALTPNSITVNGTQFEVNDSTEVENESSVHIPFSALQVGDNVEVKGTSTGGNLVAANIELKGPGEGHDSSDDKKVSQTEEKLSQAADLNVAVAGIILASGNLRAQELFAISQSLLNSAAKVQHLSSAKKIAEAVIYLTLQALSFSDVAALDIGSIASHFVQVRFADTDEKRTKALSYISGLGTDFTAVEVFDQAEALRDVASDDLLNNNFLSAYLNSEHAEDLYKLAIKLAKKEE